MDHLGMVKTCHVLVGVMFWGSQGPRLQNPCQATSKLMMHIRHVAEIMLGQ
jgi:hypothetical protein